MNDTVHTRRSFIQRSMAFLAVSPTVPTFLHNAMLSIASPADAALIQQPSGTDGKILVVVQLSGGNDGLNTIVPYADDAYHRARGSLAFAPDRVLKMNEYLGMHPNLGPLKALYDDGKMSVLQGVGYPNPNRSHFRSMDIWQTAQPEKEVVINGWLGRYFDATCSGNDPHVGVCIGETAPVAMKGDRITALSFDRPESYRYNGSDTERYMKLNTPADPSASAEPEPAPVAPSPRGRAGRNVPAPIPEVTADQQLEFLTRTAMDAQLSSDQILRVTRAHNPAGINYPGGGFGQGLRTIAAMIRGGLPTRVYYVSLGGFDTHAGQAGRHDQLMNQFAQGVSAFWADMKQQKNDQRVLMMSFSEFGRRVAQNASGGTDHGAAAPMFLFGPCVQDQGLVGRHPSLTDLDQGDLKYGIDFRSVYASILETWLEAPSKPILGQQFRTMPIIRG
jgi:uncharacterized protein (DUF1501 family)